MKTHSLRPAADRAKPRDFRYTVLETNRLLLRPFELTDAPAVHQLASQREIADTTLNIPHPYREEMAEAWILTHRQLRHAGIILNFAITLRATGELIGALGLRLEAVHNRGELGYWIGVPWWGQGYCTEAAAAALEFGFHEVGLNRIHAAHFTRNPASGRVMQKIGMRHEGTLRQHVRKWDIYEDLEKYAILRSEYEEHSR